MKLHLLSIVLVVALAACSKSADTTPTDATPAASADAPATTPATVAQADADAHFELTMEGVDAWIAAQTHLAAAEQADPSLDSAMNISEEDVDQYTARLDATPALRDAIAKAGLSTRDYAQIGEALVASLMAVGAVESGALEEIAEGMDPQHIAFVREHKAEIEAKMQAVTEKG